MKDKSNTSNPNFEEPALYPQRPAASQPHLEGSECPFPGAPHPSPCIELTSNGQGYSEPQLHIYKTGVIFTSQSAQHSACDRASPHGGHWLLLSQEAAGIVEKSTDVRQPGPETPALLLISPVILGTPLLQVSSVKWRKQGSPSAGFLKTK